jgi:hypothetical protein
VGKDKKTILIRYIVCFFVAVAIVLFVFSIKGFFTTDTKQNMQILHDAFFTAGALLMLFSGLLYVSGEGIFLGVGFVFSRAIKALIPFSHKDNETYAQYRERKSEKVKKTSDNCIFFTGLFFFLISLVFLWFWYQI